jgi:hypothetical protein
VLRGIELLQSAQQKSLHGSFTSRNVHDGFFRQQSKRVLWAWYSLADACDWAISCMLPRPSAQCQHSLNAIGNCLKNALETLRTLISCVAAADKRACTPACRRRSPRILLRGHCPLEWHSPLCIFLAEPRFTLSVTSVGRWCSVRAGQGMYGSVTWELSNTDLERPKNSVLRCPARSVCLPLLPDGSCDATVTLLDEQKGSKLRHIGILHVPKGFTAIDASIFPHANQPCTYP